MYLNINIKNYSLLNCLTILKSHLKLRVHKQQGPTV